MINYRISKVRVLFPQYQIDGYIVPSWDKYMSEYTLPWNKRLEYITGFTGSNGIAVILKDNVLFFTDGRYIEQSKKELSDSLFSIFDLKKLQNFLWDHYNTTQLGYDPHLFTNNTLKIFSDVKLKGISNNLIDEIWEERSKNSLSQVSAIVNIYPEELAGQSYVDKIQTCRLIFKGEEYNLIITSIDSISWLLNLRSNYIPFCGFIPGTIIVKNDSVIFFTDLSMISEEIKQNRSEITFLKEEVLPEVLSNLAGKVLIDEKYASSFVMNLLSNYDLQKIDDPCKLPKSCKNKIEIKHSIDFHVKDAVAVCEFLSKISKLHLENSLQNITEYDLGVILNDFRSKQKGYITESFPAICGFKENSAIVHYKANQDTAKKIACDGILLIDSGAHYEGATTDITRTISIGIPTEIQRKRYTQALKGHIALASIRFPVNTTGSNLDLIARCFLWSDYQDYAHGTGHGVGNFLSVHEGPQAINQQNTVPLSCGMILSNEPGFYKVNEFGVRIENLMYVKEACNSGWLEFEQLTLVPYSKDLIVINLLSPDEISYINLYYKKIKTLVYPLLSSNAQAWLINEIEWIEKNV